MAAEAVRAPAGRISEVFRTSATRQGAYDFLESVQIAPEANGAASYEACARRAADEPYVFVPMDGTSLNLADHLRAKDFGSIGSRERGARGLKVIDAIAVDPKGIPLGLMTMQWWARTGAPSRKRSASFATEDKEIQRWLDAIGDARARLERAAPNTRGWFQIDREGDAQYILEALSDSGHWFTVRSQVDRRLHTTGPVLRTREPKAGRRYLRQRLSRSAPVAFRLLEVPALEGRPSRLACVAIRAKSVLLHLLDKRTSRHRPLRVNVVWVREYGRGAPKRRSHSGKQARTAVDWLLLTNHPIATLADVDRVIFGYAQRWRIEDFHRAWKSGVCNVEDTQLRARSHVIKWATVLAAVAIRAERLKHLSREHPDRPASDALSKTEIDALILLKRRYKKRTEVIDDGIPNLETATRWIAEIGGYTGKSSGGPPGSITIRRGLERVRVAAEVLEALHSAPKKR